jgi:hypothetical protein
MSYPIYYVPAGDVLPVLFASFAGSTGASVTLTGLAATDIEIYKDGGVTQRASDAGYTLLDTDGIDFDGITGIHGFSIDTGDNTDAGFYTVGAWFHVVVSTVTVDSQTVSFIACAFRLMAAESVAAKPKVDVDAWLGTAAATPTTAGVPEVDVTHIAGSAVSTTTAQLGVNVVQLSADATAADNAEAFFDGTGYAGTGNVIPTVTAVTNGVTVAAGGIAAASFAAGAIDAAAIAASAIGAAEIADGAITAAKIATDAIDADALAADAIAEMALISAADVWAYATRTLSALDEDSTTLDLDATIRAAVGMASADLDTQLAALPTAAENADAVWDEDATGHQTGGTFGQAIGDPGADTNTIFKATVTDATGATVGVDVAAVLADTGTDGVVVASIAANAITASALAADAVDEIFDELIGDSTITFRQALKVFISALGGKVSGAETTTVSFRNVADNANVIVATVDADGNRSAVTLTV